MTDIFAEDFASRTPFKNYMYLLYQILFQMKTDETFFGHHKDVVQNEIRYYIQEMKSDMSYYRFLLTITWLLPILENKLLNQNYGFGNKNDNELYLKVHNWLINEIEFRNSICQCYAYGTTLTYRCDRKGIDCDCQVYFRCCEYVHPFEYM